MKGKDNFSFCSSSLNDISLYLKQKKAWIHRRKVLDSLRSRSCIVPFSHFTWCLTVGQTLVLKKMCCDVSAFEPDKILMVRSYVVINRPLRIFRIYISKNFLWL